MPTPSTRTLFLFVVCTVLAVSCGESSPVAPTDDRAAQAQSRLQRSSTPVDRPIKGECPTTFTFIDPSFKYGRQSQDNALSAAPNRAV